MDPTTMPVSTGRGNFCPAGAAAGVSVAAEVVELAMATPYENLKQSGIQAVGQ
jgi:hypothetical protein